MSAVDVIELLAHGIRCHWTSVRKPKDSRIRQDRSNYSPLRFSSKMYHNCTKHT